MQFVIQRFDILLEISKGGRHGDSEVACTLANFRNDSFKPCHSKEYATVLTARFCIYGFLNKKITNKVEIEKLVMEQEQRERLNIL